MGTMLKVYHGIAPITICPVSTKQSSLDTSKMTISAPIRWQVLEVYISLVPRLLY